MRWQEWVTLVFMGLAAGLAVWGWWIGTSPPRD